MKGKIIRLTGVLIFCIFVLILQGNLTKEIQQALPDLISLRQSEGFPIESEALAEYSGGVPVGEPEPAEVITLSGKQAMVSFQPVGGGYATMTGLPLLRGADLNTGGTVLISETLATELFLSAEVVGAELLINGETYLIAGIYQKVGGLLTALSREAEEHVYSMMNGQEYATELLLRGNGKSSAQVQIQVSQAVGQEISISETKDYGSWRSFSAFLSHMTGYLMLLGMAVVLIRYGIWMGLVGTQRFHAHQQWKPVIAWFMGAGGLILAAVLLIVFSAPRMELPLELLEGENPFDLHMYLDWITRESQRINSMSVGLWEALLPRALLWQGMLLLLALPLTALSAWRGCTIIATKS